MTVGDIMRSEVLAAGADWSLETLADFLVDNSISGAPVTTQDDELVGFACYGPTPMTRSLL